jgi:hypothetical protein
MANADSGNIETQLGNKPPVFKRKAGAKEPPFNEKTASWPGLAGKAGPDRSAGVKRVKAHPVSKGL